MFLIEDFVEILRDIANRGGNKFDEATVKGVAENWALLKQPHPQLCKSIEAIYAL